MLLCGNIAQMLLVSKGAPTENKDIIEFFDRRPPSRDMDAVSDFDMVNAKLAAIPEKLSVEAFWLK